MKFSFYKETISSITKTTTEQLLSLNHRLANLTRLKNYSDALQLFGQIHYSQCPRPDQYTLASTISTFANLRDVIFGKQLHELAICTGFKAYPHVSNTLFSLYTKTNDLRSVKLVFDEIENPNGYSLTTLLSACTKLDQVKYACELFDIMPVCNVAIWNAMITRCSNNGHNEVAMHYFTEMHRMGTRHDNFSFASVLSLCSLEVFDFGKHVHLLVIKTGFMRRTSVINALLRMYFKCGIVAEAYKAFEEVEAVVYDHITFNVMIDGLASVGRHEEALIMFKEMHYACLRPLGLTFVSVMSSCSGARIAHQLHAEAIKLGFEAHTPVSNAAITMYSSCGNLNAAYMVTWFFREWKRTT